LVLKDPNEIVENPEEENNQDLRNDVNKSKIESDINQYENNKLNFVETYEMDNIINK